MSSDSHWQAIRFYDGQSVQTWTNVKEEDLKTIAKTYNLRHRKLKKLLRNNLGFDLIFFDLRLIPKSLKKKEIANGE